MRTGMEGRARPGRRRVYAAATLAAMVGGLIGLAPGVAHATAGFGSVQVIAASQGGVPENGVCLNIVVPDTKNSPDVVVASSVSTGEGVAGLISVGNVPIGNYIARFDDCGAPVAFSSFYYGGTFNKAKATPFGVTDQGLTDLGEQLMLNSGTAGSINGTVFDGSNPGLGAPSVSVTAYTAKGKALVGQTCTNQDGHYTLFELPDNVGGIKLDIGKGSSCSNDTNFVSQWYGGGSSFATGAAITIASAGDVVANDTTLALDTKPNVSVSSITFSGTSANPTITVNGSGFGKKAPVPNPTTRPCGEPDVAGNGFDYGNNVVFWDLNDAALWQAGFPGDCIGLNFVSYSATKIVFTLGDWYRLPDSLFGRPLANGDQFTIAIKGAPLTGLVSGLS